MFKNIPLQTGVAIFLFFITVPAFAGFEFSQGSAQSAPFQASRNKPAVAQSSSVPQTPAMAPTAVNVPSSSKHKVGVLSVTKDKFPMEKFVSQPGQAKEDVIVSAANSGMTITTEQVQKIDFKTPVPASEIFALFPPEGWVVIAEQSAFNNKISFSTVPGDSWIMAMKAYAGKTGNRFYVSLEEKTVWVLGTGGQTNVVAEKAKNKPKVARTGTKPVVKKEKPKAPVKEKELKPVSSNIYPTATPVASPVMAAPVIDNGWSVASNSSLKRQLENWCAKAGYTLIWEARTDFLISGQMTFSGKFEDAVTSLFGVMYKNGRMPLRANVYTVNKIMRVSQD